MLASVAQAAEVGAVAPWRRNPLTHLDALRAIRERGKPINALLQLPFFQYPIVVAWIGCMSLTKVLRRSWQAFFLVRAAITRGAHRCAESCSA